MAADEALAIGLADKVVPDAEVYQAARDMIAQYAAGPALALRAAKQAVNRGLEVDLATGLEIERVHFAALFGTEDQKTGHAQLHGERPGKGRLRGPVTVSAAILPVRAERADRWLRSDAILKM